MGFKPSRADPDTWMKYSKDGSHYEYIAVYIDDLAIYMEDPKSFCDKLREVAPINYHLVNHAQVTTLSKLMAASS